MKNYIKTTLLTSLLLSTPMFAMEAVNLADTTGGVKSGTATSSSSVDNSVPAIMGTESAAAKRLRLMKEAKAAKLVQEQVNVAQIQQQAIASLTPPAGTDTLDGHFSKASGTGEIGDYVIGRKSAHKLADHDAEIFAAGTIAFDGAKYATKKAAHITALQQAQKDAKDNHEALQLVEAELTTARLKLRKLSDEIAGVKNLGLVADMFEGARAPVEAYLTALGNIQGSNVGEGFDAIQTALVTNDGSIDGLLDAAIGTKAEEEAAIHLLAFVTMMKHFV